MATSKRLSSPGLAEGVEPFHFGTEVVDRTAPRRRLSTRQSSSRKRSSGEDAVPSDFDQAESILAAGDADFIVLARAILYDPDGRGTQRRVSASG
jgi:2,4-dienoyl-CoA reductase-like NADH-dependent reductase (Old Yellow Enzyme family)